MMRIGYDAKRLFNNYTGLGNYSRTLLQNLARAFPQHAYHLYTPRARTNTRTLPFLAGQPFEVHLPGRPLGAWWRSWRITEDLLRDGIELYHGLSHEIPFSLPTSGIKSVVSMHDLIFKHQPEDYSWLDRQVYNLKFRHACQRADHVLAISEATKRDVQHLYGIPEQKITVIYQSCSEQFFMEVPAAQRERTLTAHGLPQAYMLYVGSIIPRKRLLALVEALRIARTSLPLVVIGEGKAYKQQVLAYVHKHRLEDRVLFPRRLSFSDFPALYQQARLLAYPSVREGFGIPVIEALFSKTPVITSPFSSLPEAAGPGGYLVDPDDPEALADALDRVLEDEGLRQQLIAQGHEYVQRFRPEPLSRQLMQLYERVRAS